MLVVAHDELLTIWLSDKSLNTLEEEPSAYNALKLTEKLLKTKLFKSICHNLNLIQYQKQILKAV